MAGTGQPQTSQEYYRDVSVFTFAPTGSIVPRAPQLEGTPTTIRFLTTLTHNDMVMTHFVETVITLYTRFNGEPVTTTVFTGTSGVTTSGPIQLPPATATSPATSPATNPATNRDPGANEMASGATIGIAVGAAVVVLATGLLGYYAWSQRKKRRAEQSTLQMAQTELARIQATQSISSPSTIVQSGSGAHGSRGQPGTQRYDPQEQDPSLKPGARYVPYHTSGYRDTPSSVPDRRSDAPNPYAPSEYTDASVVVPSHVWADARPEDWGYSRRPVDGQPDWNSPRPPLPGVQKAAGWLNASGSGGEGSGSGGTDRSSQQHESLYTSRPNSP